MISTVALGVICVAAASLSYMFASYYGIALAAVGMTSVLGSIAGVTGMVSAASTVSDIIDSKGSGSESDKAVVSLLDTVSARNLVSVRTYSVISGMMTSFAAFSALFYTSAIDSIDLLSMRVFGGIITGACAAFILSGLLISSVRITGRVALRDIGKNDDDTGATSALRGAVIPAFVAIAFPTVVGLLAGVKALAGFIIASVVTGYIIITSINNSGMHYENTGVQSLSSLLKMMAVFSIAFIPVFMKVGGFLFQ
jgi:Na+/H+-translocating membrane pyrophosphatase